jgi:hypothetical protein
MTSVSALPINLSIIKDAITSYAPVLLPCDQSPLVFLLGTARRSERDSAELVYKFI